MIELKTTSEGQRINFLINRDGLLQTLEWAERTKRIYRTAVLNKSHHASTRKYKLSFITSYLVLKRFVNSTGGQYNINNIKEELK